VTLSWCADEPFYSVSQVGWAWRGSGVEGRRHILSCGCRVGIGCEFIILDFPIIYIHFPHNSPVLIVTPSDSYEPGAVLSTSSFKLHLVISANSTHLYKGSYLRHLFVTH
jgi:hypothetical protein